MVVLLESNTYMNSSNPSALTRSVLLYTWGGHIEENCGCSVGEQHIHELEQSFSTYKVSIIIYMGGGILRRTVVVLLESNTYMNSSNPSALTRSVLLYTWGGGILRRTVVVLLESNTYMNWSNPSVLSRSVLLYRVGGILRRTVVCW